MSSSCKIRNRRTERVRSVRVPSTNPQADHALEAIKRDWLMKELADVLDPELRQRLQRAGEESASLAWVSGFPQLTLPELLAEKAREARLQFSRQQAIRQRSEPRLSFAA